ncbi:MAG: TolC family protein [Gelidibacter sp.]
MQFRTTLFILGLLVATVKSQAQNIRPISLQEAVELALTNADASKLADAKLNTAESELNVTKNLQYPDVKLSGQYLRLTNADVNLKFASGSSASEEGTDQESSSPNVNQLVLGQANVSMPLFSGFKLKNIVKAGENQLEAAKFTNANDKEQLAMQTISNFLNLYKATQTIALIQENLKTAQQREKDFSAMEQNGLLARNDLLKSQLQVSNTEISLEEAKKAQYILNYQLAVLLKLPEDTVFDTQLPEDALLTPTTSMMANSRSDLQALQANEKAAEHQIKVAQSNYYPSLSIVGGYIALDVHNAISVTNAMNIGVGVSYNLADIFKTKSDVKLAKSKVEELKYTIDKYSSNIKVEIENAKRTYELALKTSEVYSQSELQATENYRIVKDKYDNGLEDTNDLLEADVEQLQAKINLANSKADSTLKYYELLTSQGQLINSLQN